MNIYELILCILFITLLPLWSAFDQTQIKVFRIASFFSWNFPYFWPRLSGCLIFRQFPYFWHQEATSGCHLLSLFVPGAAVACYWACAFISLQEWFTVKRSVAISIFMAGVSVGTFVWPPLVTFWSDLYTWKGALVLGAGLHLQGLIPMALLRPAANNRVLSNNQSNESKQWTKTNDRQKHAVTTLGANKDAGGVDSEEFEGISKDCEGCSRVDDDSEKQMKQNNSGVTKLLTDPAFYIFYFGAFLLGFSHIIPLSYITARGRLSGYSETASALLLSMLGITSGVGRPLSGLLGDWVGNKRILAAAAGSILAGAASVLSVFCTTYAWMMVYAVIYGSLACKLWYFLQFFCHIHDIKLSIKSMC